MITKDLVGKHFGIIQEGRIVRYITNDCWNDSDFGFLLGISRYVCACTSTVLRILTYKVAVGTKLRRAAS